MEENKGYPRYQYSVFTNDPKNGQLVIRCETFKELLDAKRDIDQILEKIGAKDVVIEKPIQKSIPVEQFQEKCERCGANKILSRKGNMVCEKFCWTKRGGE